jgi:hypothetical protein
MDCFIDVVNDKPSSNPFCSELNNLDQLAIGYVTLMTKKGEEMKLLMII